MRRLAGALLVLTLFTGCFGDARETTESGKGFPRLSVDIPDAVELGSRFVATLTVDNPGPGDMDGVVVAFAPIGPAQGATALPNQLVGLAKEGEDNPSVADIDPEPQGVGEGGVIYRFGSLAEGDSMVITFDLNAPVVPGSAANSVQVYDSADVSRARGVRLETLVER